MRITIDDGDLRRDLDKMKSQLPAAAQEAGRAQMKKLVEELKDRVIEMIPDRGGWYDLYKDSIKINKIDDDHYELTTTIAEIQYSSIDAEKSLIWITGSEEAARVLSQFNPWTLDTIPAIDDGFTANLLVRPASESETTTFRTRRISDRKEIERRLKLTNIKVLKFDPELPEINGRVMADVPFLAKRLEYGLGGFPRTPIWTRITREAEVLSKGESVKDFGQNVYSSRWWKTRQGNIGKG
jgi:hypothetical protein